MLVKVFYPSVFFQCGLLIKFQKSCRIHCLAGLAFFVEVPCKAIPMYGICDVVSLTQKGRITHVTKIGTYLTLQYIYLLKTLWKQEKLPVTSNFSFSHGVFYPFRELSTVFIQFEIVVCKLFQFEDFKICCLRKS